MTVQDATHGGLANSDYNINGEFGKHGSGWSSHLKPIEGVGRSTAFYLEVAGFEHIGTVAVATVNQIKEAVPHVGDEQAATIKSNAQAVRDEQNEAEASNPINLAIVGNGDFIADKPDEVVTGLIEGAVEELSAVDDIDEFEWPRMDIGYLAYDKFGDRVSTWLDATYTSGRYDGLVGKQVFSLDNELYEPLIEAETYSDCPDDWADRMEEIPFLDRMSDSPMDVDWGHAYMDRRNRVMEWADTLIVLTEWEYGFSWRQSAKYHDTEVLTMFDVEHQTGNGSGTSTYLSEYSPGFGEHDVSHYTPDDEETFANVTRRSDDGVTQSGSTRPFLDGDLMAKDGDIGVEGATYGAVDEDEHRNTEEFKDGKGKGTTGSKNWGA